MKTKKLTRLHASQVRGLPVNVMDFGAKGDGVTDDRAAIQKAIDFIEASGKRHILTAPANCRFMLESLIDVPHYGGKAGLVITRADLVWIDFNGATIAFNTNNAGLGSAEKDAVLAIAPVEGTSGYAFPCVKNLYIDGGNWDTQDKRPKSVFKMDYIKMAYGLFENCRFRYAKESVWSSDGFVMNLKNIRCSFAGDNGTGFNFQCIAKGGANTGYNLQSCTADYAGMYGFRFHGNNGHTYCNLTNCYADFIGQTESRVTIEENFNEAAAYRVENVRGFVMTACGTEYCSRLFTFNNARNITVSSLYSLGMGHTDKVTKNVDFGRFMNYFEKVSLMGIEFRDNKAKPDKYFRMVSPEAFNSNHISIPDSCMPTTEFEFVSGTPTSNQAGLVETPTAHLIGFNRRGAGDAAVRTGKPTVGHQAGAWHNASDVLEQTFYAQTGEGETDKVIDICTLSSYEQGGIGIFFEVYQNRLDSPHADKSIGSFSVAKTQSNIHPMVYLTKLLRDGETTPTPTTAAVPVITWDEGALKLKLPLPTTGYYVKVTAVPRASANYVRVAWA